MCLPWYDHVNRSTRESSHAPSNGELDIHGTLGPSHCGGVWAADVRLLPLRAHSSPCLLREFVSRESHTPVAWTSVLQWCLACTCVSPHQIPVRPERTSGHGDPVSRQRDTASLELDGWSRGLGSSHGDSERLPRLPPTAKVQGRLQCDSPGIEVQLSISKGRLQRHLMGDICSTRNAHALSMNLAQIFQTEISEELSMASLEQVLLPR